MTAGKKILVTGANGQLGRELKDLSDLYSQLQFIFLSREDLPIEQPGLVRQAFSEYSPDYCVNCAAYTKVDKAESEQRLAMQVNSEAVGVLATVCKDHSTRFVHISTDYVFDGTGSKPYTEEDPVNPINFYGQSKLAGERQAMQFNPDSIIIRTSWVYSFYGNNFVKTMLSLMKGRPGINVVNDQFGSPTYAADLAEVILKMVGNWHPGIYNYSNNGVISWFDFATAIKVLGGSNCSINPISTAQYPTPARRPMYSVLDKKKIQQTFGIELKDWKESLAICIRKLLST